MPRAAFSEFRIECMRAITSAGMIAESQLIEELVLYPGKLCAQARGMARRALTRV